MTTGAAWNLDDPKKPWADWDPDANIVIPIFVDDWLAELGVTYGSHSIITASPLQCVNQGLYSAGIIGVRMSLVGLPPAFTPGKKYPFTLRIIGNDTLTRDDRTLWLRVKDR